MPNHYHLLVRSATGMLSRGMRHINGIYTLWLNVVRKWEGPVFKGRFSSQLVEDEEYLRILIAYIHLNPLTAHLVKRLDSEAWTSHRAYIGRESAPSWLTVETMLALFDGRQKFHEFVRSVHTKAVEYPSDFNPETGLFKKRAIAKRVQRANQAAEVEALPNRFRPPAEVLDEVCRMTGASKEELMRSCRGPGANPARRFAVWALHRGSGLIHRKIAGELDMPTHQVSKLLSRIHREEPLPPLEKWIRVWLAKE